MKILASRILIASLTFWLGVGGVKLRQQAQATTSQLSKDLPSVSFYPRDSAIVREVYPTEKVTFILRESILTIGDNQGNYIDEGFWQWLKASIDNYQSAPNYKSHSLILPLESGNKYKVHLSKLTPMYAAYINQYFQRENLPLLSSTKTYVKFAVYLDDFICPNWFGLIDVQNSRLIYFHGSGG